MKRTLLLLIVTLLALTGVQAQRLMETLDRGLVAIKTSGGVYTSWRIPGDEWFGVTYNLYRDGSLIAEGLDVSNFSDAGGTLQSTYQVAPVSDGVVGEKCDPVSVWEQQYLRIQLVDIEHPSKPGQFINDAFQPNDISVADLDGDGQYELIVKRENNDFSYKNDSAFTRFEAYKQDGTLLWVINMGPNMINFNHVETDCMAYDFDGDGKAEVVLRATDGSVMPDGYTFRSTIRPSVNERQKRGITESPSTMYQQENDEWLVLLDGATGKTLDYEIFDSNAGGVTAGNNLDRRETNGRDFYYPGGKGYGHRANKFHFGAPYLDGVHPSIYLGRGCYTNMHACTWDVVAGAGKGSGSQKKLQRRWVFATDNTSDPWFGQGFHNFAIVDVDNDGRDEICHGNMVLDEFGKRLSSTGLGHGDAQHYGDLDPFHKGKEGFRCLEDNPGAVFVDAASSEKLIHWRRGNDNGRCLAGNFSDRWPGAQLWTTDSKLWSATLSRAADHVINGGNGSGITMNARIFWDGDVLEESFDYASRDGFEGVGFSIRKFGKGEIFNVGSVCHTNNSTKGNPCIQADLFGDWREEFILREANNNYIRIYTTVVPTDFRNYSLMYDHDYRNGVYWQMNGYNQPPHVSYYLGQLEGIMLPPPPLCTNGKVEVSDALTPAHDGQFVYIGQPGDVPATVGYEKFLGVHDFEKAVHTVSVSGTVRPKAIQVFAFTDNVLDGGLLDGDMHLEKLGQRDLKMAADTYTYSGETNVWFGSLTTDATFTASPLVLRRFAELHSAGNFQAGITAEHGAVLHPAGDGAIGTLATTRLQLCGADTIAYDVKADGSDGDHIVVDSLIVDGFNFSDAQSRLSVAYNPCVRFQIVGEGQIPAGDYVVIEATRGIRGDVTAMTVAGLEGMGGKVLLDGNKVIVHIKEQRKAWSIAWTGAASSLWDFNETANFAHDGEADVFVTGDNVVFDATAQSTAVQVAETLYPASVVFEGGKDYTLAGDYPLAGSMSLVKRGTGTLTVNNRNTFTGGVRIEEGTLQFSAYADDQNGGSLGAYTTEEGQLYVGRGATLRPAAAGLNPLPITVSPGAVIHNDVSFTQVGAVIGDTLMQVGSHEVVEVVGTADGDSTEVVVEVPDYASVKQGTLTKRGSGTLTFSAYNRLSKLIVEQGTVNIPAEYAGQTALGDTLELRGGQVVQTNSSYVYQNSRPVWYVPAGANATITGACRMEQRNKLIGSGTLTFDQKIVSSCPRFYQYGDWSEFEGTVVARASGDGTTFMIHNTLGMPKGTLNVPEGITVQIGGNVNGSTGQTRGTFSVGVLTGKGHLATGAVGDNAFEVGALNTNFTFSGTSDATIFKVGTGTMTMTANTGKGSIVVRGGALRINNASSATTSATGTGTIRVQQGGTLMGRYYADNDQISVEAGGCLSPGYLELDGITVTGSVQIADGGILEFTLRNTPTKPCTYLHVGKTLYLNGVVRVNRGSYAQPKAGDEFQLFTAKVVKIAPANTLRFELPELPEGLAWDTEGLRTAEGKLRVVEGTSIAAVTNGGMVAVTVYAANGQPVTTFSTEAGRVYDKLDDAGIPRGIYIIRVEGPDGMETKKYIKK